VPGRIWTAQEMAATLMMLDRLGVVVDLVQDRMLSAWQPVDAGSAPRDGVVGAGLVGELGDGLAGAVNRSVSWLRRRARPRNAVWRKTTVRLTPGARRRSVECGRPGLRAGPGPSGGLVAQVRASAPGPVGMLIVRRCASECAGGCRWLPGCCWLAGKRRAMMRRDPPARTSG